MAVGPVGVIARRDVASALAIANERVVCLVGGGGKTSLLLAFASALGRGVLTTTTRMGADRTGGFPVVWSPDGVFPRFNAVSGRPEGDGPVIVWRRLEGRKALGFAPEVIDTWIAGSAGVGQAAGPAEGPAEVGGVERRVDVGWPEGSGGVGAGWGPVLVEADGARHLPFKAPADHEPVIPRATTMVVAVIGADALGRVIADQCFRPLRVAAIAQCQPYERLTAAHAARVLCDERGGRKGVPPGARFHVAITKVAAGNLAMVTELAELLSVGDEAPTSVALVADEPPPR